MRHSLEAKDAYKRIEDAEKYGTYERTLIFCVKEFMGMTPERRLRYFRELYNVYNPDRAVYVLGPSTTRNFNVVWLVKRGLIRRRKEGDQANKEFLSTELGNQVIEYFELTLRILFHANDLEEKDF